MIVQILNKACPPCEREGCENAATKRLFFSEPFPNEVSQHFDLCEECYRELFAKQELSVCRFGSIRLTPRLELQPEVPLALQTTRRDGIHLTSSLGNLLSVWVDPELEHDEMLVFHTPSFEKDNLRGRFVGSFETGPIYYDVLTIINGARVFLAFGNAPRPEGLEHLRAKIKKDIVRLQIEAVERLIAHLRWHTSDPALSENWGLHPMFLELEEDER